MISAQTSKKGIKHAKADKEPLKYYVSKEVGGARKLQFLLIYSTIYADVGGWA